MATDHPKQATATVLGVVAIGFWSSTVAVSRILTETLGTFTAAASTFLTAGVIGCSFLLVSGRFRQALCAPTRYLLVCGGLFLVYVVSFYAAMGLSINRQQAIEVGVINYLWPAATLVFSVPVLRKRAGVLLVPGAVIAFAGVALAMSQAAPFSWEVLAHSLRSNPLPYLLSFVAAITWGLYSTLSRRLAADEPAGSVVLFIAGTGLALLAARMFFREQTAWSPRAVGALCYMALGPALLAYSFWDTAMRRGNIILVAALSYLTPLLSVLVSGLFLDVKIGASLLVAALLVILGAVVCKVSIVEPPMVNSCSARVAVDARD
jgi:drug/metabolite transporter (DMT)-like permease